MIPKYSNPSVLLKSTAIVSRAALLDDSDDDSEVRSATDPEHAQMVARLENILKRSIGDVLPQVSEEEPDQHSRKKKKRKVEKEMKLERDATVAGAEVVVRTSCISLLLPMSYAHVIYVAFRLFSGMTQPRPIVLAPKPQPILAYVPSDPHTRCGEQAVDHFAVDRKVLSWKTRKLKQTGVQPVHAKSLWTSHGSWPSRVNLPW